MVADVFVVLLSNQVTFYDIVALYANMFIGHVVVWDHALIDCVALLYQHIWIVFVCFFFCPGLRCAVCFSRVKEAKSTCQTWQAEAGIYMYIIYTHSVLLSAELEETTCASVAKWASGIATNVLSVGRGEQADPSALKLVGSWICRRRRARRGVQGRSLVRHRGCWSCCFFVWQFWMFCLVLFLSR